ncbi:BMC domain-containing protein [Ilyobacter sp.]|uniref:BMC domain-containing protein n=1 Tax=Ilyobacter sp. TaxID=3100343 RepID=UPI00356A4B22
MGNSLGFIEVVGMLGAIEACDAAVKSANVKLVGCELTKGFGMVTITLRGEVGAVNAAVSSAVAAAERITKVVSHTIIARPSEGLEKIIKGNAVQSEDEEVQEDQEVTETRESKKEVSPKEEAKEEAKEKNMAETSPESSEDEYKKKDEKIQDVKVSEKLVTEETPKEMDKQEDKPATPVKKTAKSTRTNTGRPRRKTSATTKEQK